MIYEIKCGCGVTSNVKASIPSFEWECPCCHAVVTSSVPTDGSGVMLQNVGQGGFVSADGDGIEASAVGTNQRARDLVDGALRALEDE